MGVELVYDSQEANRATKAQHVLDYRSRVLVPLFICHPERALQRVSRGKAFQCRSGYQPSLRSFQLRFTRSISQIFFSRRQRLICFSRAIAL